MMTMQRQAASGPTEVSQVPRRRLRRRWAAALACCAGLLGAVTSPQEALAATVVLNTSPLAGVSGRLEFSLFDNNLPAANSVVISNILSNGTFIGTECSLGCSGGPTSFTINDTLGLGQLLYDLALGTTLSFDLSYTTNFSGVPGTDAPDRLSVSLLDPDTNFTLVGTEIAFPDDALLTIDLIGAGVVSIARNVSPAVTVNVAALAVPEPGSMALTTIALLALVGRRRAVSPRALTPA